MQHKTRTGRARWCVVWSGRNILNEKEKDIGFERVDFFENPSKTRFCGAGCEDFVASKRFFLGPTSLTRASGCAKAPLLDHTRS